MDVIQLIQQYERHETSIKYSDQGTSLMEPVRYIMQLKSKRIRPLLLLIGYTCYNQDIERAMNAAYGLEVFHNFTLMHDDIMDEATLRRGEQAAHLKFGMNEAIISGDAMAILAYKYIMKDCSDNNLRKILNIFNKTSLDICIGQQMDMEFEKIQSIESDQYIEMIRLKTAVFLGMALQIGALLAGANEEEALALFEYGQNVGIAFQIQDDLLDLTGDQSKVGKQIGGDIIRNKKTLLVCKAHELASENQRKNLDELMSDVHSGKVEKILTIIELFKTLGLFEVINNDIDSYFSKAEKHLTTIKLSQEKLAMLHLLTQMIRDRKS